MPWADAGYSKGAPVRDRATAGAPIGKPDASRAAQPFGEWADLEGLSAVEVAAGLVVGVLAGLVQRCFPALGVAAATRARQMHTRGGLSQLVVSSRAEGLRKRKQSTILLWRVWLWRCLA